MRGLVVEWWAVPAASACMSSIIPQPKERARRCITDEWIDGIWGSGLRMMKMICEVCVFITCRLWGRRLPQLPPLPQTLHLLIRSAPSFFVFYSFWTNESLMLKTSPALQRSSLVILSLWTRLEPLQEPPGGPPSQLQLVVICGTQWRGQGSNQFTGTRLSHANAGLRRRENSAGVWRLRIYGNVFSLMGNCFSFSSFILK